MHAPRPIGRHRRTLAPTRLTGPAASEPPHATEASSAPRNGYLRGAAIRRTAVKLLATSEFADEPIHYTDWFALLSEAGFGVAGRDPQATFLTEINRSPVVTRTPEAGTYALDRAAGPELLRQRNDLQAELVTLNVGQQTIAGITTSRERRKELMSALGQVERALEEIAEGLSLDPFSF
jgi:hypothetical protein